MHRDDPMRRLLLYLTVSVLMVAGEPAIGATLDLSSGTPSLGSRLLAAPVRWMVSVFGPELPSCAPRIEDSAPLEPQPWDSNDATNARGGGKAPAAASSQD
jgi:hypothetical protein